MIEPLLGCRPPGHCGGGGDDPLRAPGEVPAAVTTVTYLHTDALGSPLVSTDANRQILNGGRRQYEPYGAPFNASATSEGPGYTGHVYDGATGLSYMQQRYYDPLAARFLSVDPVEASPASFNRYWYANDDPYRFT